MGQAAADIGKGWGSNSTALFYWPTTNYSYGFDDQGVRYHLDLRFQTNKVTFITGNNGIPSGASRDGTTVDVRSYIKGSPILEPRNLPIPAGCRFVGYYNDPNFTTPWDKIGSPLEHDETVYIKITPQENVILYYKPVPAGGGTVSVDAEGLNPETGTPAGSTATANPGYTFDGWYADEECTQLLSRDAKYVPTKGSSDRWVDGTTYYAKFKENTVTLTFVAEEHVDHLEMDSVPDNVVSYEFSEDRKTLTVVLEAASGSPVTVKGVAEDGFAIKEWTIDGRTGNLTTADSLTTAKTDDPAATNLWTDRTYHVWAEVLKTITVTKEVHIIGSLHADDVDATVYFALKDKSQDSAPWVRNADGTIYTTSIHIVNGVPESTAQFTDLPAGTYEVWEVADTDANTLAPGSEIAEGIFVSRIQTWISDTDTGNNVVVTDDDPHGEIKVINTLNHSGEAMTFRANKKWYTSKNSYADPNAPSNVDVPEGAWVDFTLYRVYSTDGHEEEVETIRLDGTPNVIGEEAAWGAAFRDLATVDEDDHPVSYYVKETAMADLSEYDYYTTFNDTTYTNGGSISNVVAYGEVNATKEIELPANISNADKHAFIDSLRITVTGPAEVAESRRVTRTLDKDSFEVTESRRTVTYGPLPQEVIVLKLTAKAEDLPAGTYTITESGYDDDSLAYNWDSAHSWIKADKLPAEQAALANQEQYGKDSIDALVGVNVTDGNFTTKVDLLNSYVVQDVKVTKVWDDMGQEGADHPSVNMTLYRTDGSGNRITVSTQIIGANQTGDNLTLTWANMPQNYTYSVEEAPLRGYRLESITGDQTQGFIVTNQKATTIKVVKTDQSGDALAGAVFSGDLIDGTVTTEITGEGDEAEAVIIEDTQVPLGEYTINEDAPPAGYYPLDGPVVISVDQGEAGSDVVVTAEINGRPSSSVVVDRPDKDNRPDYWVVTIKNSSGVEL
ncbi:MAG: Cna B-type domain-containing protein, partial [Clostridiales bacterium]|nr:Cna B-type domain-containing protein [Clostridiales bacterium]